MAVFPSRILPKRPGEKKKKGGRGKKGKENSRGKKKVYCPSFIQNKKLEKGGRQEHPKKKKKKHTTLFENPIRTAKRGKGKERQGLLGGGAHGIFTLRCKDIKREMRKKKGKGAQTKKGKGTWFSIFLLEPTS